MFEAMSYLFGDGSIFIIFVIARPRAGPSQRTKHPKSRAGLEDFLVRRARGCARPCVWRELGPRVRAPSETTTPSDHRFRTEFSFSIPKLGPKPYYFIGFGDIYGPKPYYFIGFGDIYGPKPY